ncbi:hypothetical protein LJC14_07170, partial [Treponema sp. OttesenSCG-928-L16]|nr:hypothetical protein [Treponema sp. OttesenSCG-928-L16]
SVISEVLNDNGSLNKAKLKAELKSLKDGKNSEDFNELQSLADLQDTIDEFSKLLKQMYSELEEKERAKYPVLTDDDIIELLVNQKWYGAIINGIEQLYRSVSHNIAGRVTELAERYEHTLSELEKEVVTYEKKVKSHLKRMGFKW